MIVTIKQTLIAFGLLLAVAFPAFARSGNPVLPGFMPILKSCILIRQRNTTFILLQTVSLDGVVGILLFFVRRLEELEG